MIEALFLSTEAGAGKPNSISLAKRQLLVRMKAIEKERGSAVLDMFFGMNPRGNVHIDNECMESAASLNPKHQNMDMTGLVSKDNILKECIDQTKQMLSEHAE